MLKHLASFVVVLISTTIDTWSIYICWTIHKLKALGGVRFHHGMLTSKSCVFFICMIDGYFLYISSVFFTNTSGCIQVAVYYVIAIWVGRVMVCYRLQLHDLLMTMVCLRGCNRSMLIRDCCITLPFSIISSSL